jgi:F-type H+-transporting ATPase subunit delta
MAQVQHHSKLAVAYARSLLELAAETGAEGSVGQELEGIAQVLLENRTFVQFLADPTVSVEHRAGSLRNIFAGRVSPLVLNLMLVMNERGRIRHLGEVCGAFDMLLDEKLGKIEVDVTVASQLDAAAMEEVRQLVNRALKKDSVVHQYVDPSILGGLVLRVGDRQIDGSVKTQLENIKQKLLTTRAS